MTEYSPRLFESDAEVMRIGEGLLDHSLPRSEWTHEAHLAACLYIVRERADIRPEQDMAPIISGYNVAVGGVNDDAQGYHETITQCFIHGVRLHLVGREREESLVDSVNALLTSPYGRRDWPLGFYSKQRLFSVEARRGLIDPDLAPFAPV